MRGAAALLTPQFILPIADELVVDLFAGGGGASTGIEQAIGRHVDIAINHDPQAVSLHQANHPQTLHLMSDVFEVDPVTVTAGRPIGLLWASPDCKHFSKAKGGKPVSKKIRALADVVAEWAEKVRPRVIVMENVEEFVTWGELDEHGYPIASEKGKLFDAWRSRFTRCDYVSDFRVLRACDFGAPTIRKRLFGIFRCDGLPIVWPEPTHGKGRRPYRTAAECIDWSLPCPSIFERDRPLAEATMRRIAHGIKRYVLENPKPFIVRIGHTGHGDGGKVRPVDAPLSTVTTKAEHLLCSPTMIEIGYGERPGQTPRAPGLQRPLGTVVGAKKHALVAAFLAKHYGGNESPGWPVEKPISTVTTQDHHHLVAATVVRNNFGDKPADAIDEPLRTITTQHNKHALIAASMVKLRGTSNSAGTDEPLHTISAGGQHHAEVRALLIKYYGTDQDPRLEDPLHTVTTKDRFGLVTVDGAEYAIADIGMRMLQPRELYRAQGFPDSYVIDRGADGRVLPKSAQVRMCGNSVCPPIAAALVRVNFAEAMRAAA